MTDSYPDSYVFTDEDHDQMVIRPLSADRPGVAYLSASPALVVPAHRLAELVTAMYRACGQPVPDLPVVDDEAEVKRLAQMIYDDTYGYPVKTVIEAAEDLARLLLASGVTLPPEPTP